MTLDEWELFIKFATNVAQKHPTLFQTTDADILREYLSFHQIHGNLFVVDGAFSVLHPIRWEHDDSEWEQPQSTIYRWDVLYAENKESVKRLLQQIAKADRKMDKVYAYRRGRLIEWTPRLTERFLYGKEESPRASSSDHQDVCTADAGDSCCAKVDCSRAICS